MQLNENERDESGVNKQTSGTVVSPKIDLSTDSALATMTSSGSDSNFTASSPDSAIIICNYYL